MKQFFTDLFGVIKCSWNFTKKHWFGYIVLNIVAFLVFYSSYICISDRLYWKKARKALKDLEKSNKDRGYN